MVERAQAFVEAGADAIFAEAMTDLSMYKEVVDAVDVPVLANITEFGQTPLYSSASLGHVGIAMALYPHQPSGPMNQAALNVYRSIREKGHQRDVVEAMQTRMDLYDFRAITNTKGSLTRSSGTTLRSRTNGRWKEIDRSRPPGPGGRGNSPLHAWGKTGTGPTYRGYDITDLAENTCFEEVAHLIRKGEPPRRANSTPTASASRRLRSLPPALKEVLERIPASAHPWMSCARVAPCWVIWRRSRTSRSSKMQRTGPRRVPFDHQLLVSLLP